MKPPDQLIHSPGATGGENSENDRYLQSLYSIERELYLFRMEMQESLKKLCPKEEQKTKRCKGMMLILAIFIVSLACVTIAGSYFFFNFLKDSATPKAIPTFYIKNDEVPPLKHTD